MERSFDEIIEIYEQYCNSLKYCNRFFVDDEIHKFFDKIIENSTRIIQKNNILYRARINKQDDRTPFRGKDIGLPPKEVLSLGRVNPYGINYLYLATDVETSISEVRPKIGDCVTVGSFKAKRDITVAELSAFTSCTTNKVETPTSRETLNFMSCLSNEFRKPIDTIKELEYLPMQYFTEYCKSKGIDGIKFLSSVMSNSIIDRNFNKHFNITLFDDTNVEYVDSEVYEVDEIKYIYEKIV
jgi:RES domain